MSSSKKQKLSHINRLIDGRFRVEMGKPKVGFLFLGRKRPGFDMDWGKQMKEEAIKLIQKQDSFDNFIVQSHIFDDPSLRDALQQCQDEHVDVICVLQTTISDGRLAPILAQQWDDTVILWATPEKQTGEIVSSCSLVGCHVFASTLRQLGRPFEVVYGGLDWKESERQLKQAVRVATSKTVLSKTKIGLIGYHAPGFVDLYPDQVAMCRTFGTQMQQVDLQEYMDLIKSIDEKEVQQDIAEFKKNGVPLKDVKEEDLPQLSRGYLALKKIIAAENFDALAVRCWPELPHSTDQWSYVAMARLCTEGYPIACEGDLDGALSMLVGKLLGFGAVYLSDWLEHDKETINIWHGGQAPFQLCEIIGKAQGPHIAKHFNNKKVGVVDATIRSSEPVTLFRLWACDHQYHLMALEGKTIPPKRHLLGSNGLVHVEGRDVTEFFEESVHKGMPHHLCIVHGHHRRELKAISRRLGIQFMQQLKLNETK